MKPIQVPHLIVEVTRQCQLSCCHCLRGESRPSVISKVTLRTLLSGIDRINQVTFTGGEPFLHPEVIENFIKICASRRISVGSFYIATNGIIFSEKSKLSTRGLMAIINLWNLCDNNDGSQIKVSLDPFHYANEDAGELLRVFSFVEFAEDEPYSIIYEGNAKDNFDPTSKNIRNACENKIPLDYYDSMLYCSTDGLIVFECDLSYERIDEEGISISEGKKIMRKLYRDEHEN